MTLCEWLVANFVLFPVFDRYPLAQIGILLKLQPFQNCVTEGSNQLLGGDAAHREQPDTGVVILIFSTHVATPRPHAVEPGQAIQ